MDVNGLQDQRNLIYSSRVPVSAGLTRIVASRCCASSFYPEIYSAAKFSGTHSGFSVTAFLLVDVPRRLARIVERAFRSMDSVIAAITMQRAARACQIAYIISRCKLPLSDSISASSMRLLNGPIIFPGRFFAML